MLIGIHTLPTDESLRPDALAVAVEERGFDLLLVGEHSHIPVRQETPFPRGGPFPHALHHVLDPFVALTAAAAATSQLQVGTGVVLMVQRDVIQTAKAIASLDLLSGGRTLIGVGAGWVREEMRNHGTDPRTRGRLLDEQVAAMIQIWTQERAEYHGDFVDFEPIFSWPKPVHSPHPPVFSGGHGEAGASRAARCGGWMPGAVQEPAKVAEQLAMVTPGLPVIANAAPPQADVVAAYREAGAAGVTFHVPELPATQTLHLLDELTELINA